MENGKYKILLLSDHALSTSGVGTQSRHLVQGLLEKGCWTIRQFGAAIKHSDYRTIKVTDDFIIKPIDGFGTPDSLRITLATERPDILFLFTDPRFFIWLYEMEDEIHQICPIVYWHVWDNYPFPDYNLPLYESTDLINCHSHLTYSMVSKKFPEKTNFIPHALPEDIYFELPIAEKENYKTQLLGEHKDKFVLFWMSRNAKRKRPGDLLWAWKIFMEKIKKEGKDDAVFIMHTDPLDQEGPNLGAVSEMLGTTQSVVFSSERVEFDKINILHNIADASINMSFAEGFGLSTLESMQAGTPIIAAKTGGLTRQVVDHRDGSENGIALDIELQTLVGSQQVPYIYEDYVGAEQIADAIYRMYKLSPEERKALGQKAKKYVESEFNYANTVNSWHDTMMDTLKNWKERRERWSLETL